MRISDWSSDVCSSDLPALGCAVYGFGLEWLGRRISDNRVSLKSFSWSAAAICAAFTLALAAFMFFVAYSATGASSFLMLLYGLAMLILPLWGVYLVVRGARKSAYQFVQTAPPSSNHQRSR